MRKLVKYVSAIVLLLFSTESFAQKTATATMKVSATVVNGSTLNDITNLDIDFQNKSIQAGGFEVVTARAQEMQIENSESVLLTNEFGDKITIHPNSHSLDTDGSRNVQILANIDGVTPTMRGTYSGNITTTISYF